MSGGDGNGWVVLPDGSRRWGRFGASGLLLYAAGGRGGGHVLLQHRAAWSHQGDTWGMPGGARDSGETSVEAALREFGEEVAGDLGPVILNGIHRLDHVVWSYDTVLARLPERRPFAPGNAESTAIRWVALEEVASLPLLPAFGTMWPRLRAALAERLVLVVDATGSATHAPNGQDGAAGDAATAAGARRLRDDLAALAAVGLAGAELPAGAAGSALHRWFPAVRLVVPATAGTGTVRPVGEAARGPGVEVVPAVGGPGATVLELLARRRPGDRVLVVADDPEVAGRAAAAGANVAPLSWLPRRVA
ncbi:NUDIX hydrolase [Marinactinospora rubrisoli]|uniref:NUDIX domain-containing protein n=1 Tax=Marinactinospora rubrisoli TaxID=2715399 RepID=A0ABW2KA96_9ACTN